jgi:hypothetical protein
MQTDPVEQRTSDRPISFYLTHEEGLVLFDLLGRGHDSPDRTYRVEHSAEQVVLWGLEAILESWLVAPFRPNYQELLDVAREELAMDLVD